VTWAGESLSFLPPFRLRARLQGTPNPDEELRRLIGGDNDP
jgi:hypothetical protein